MSTRFTVCRQIGEGGQGRVFSVMDAARAGAIVALKETLRGGVAGHGDELKREFALLTRLSHPHLVAVHDWFDRSPLTPSSVAQAPAAYTQEWVDGLDLFRALRDAPQPRRELIFTQVMSAMAYLHALDVVHLDLKPDNVLVSRLDTERPTARVLDFGIAAVVGAVDQSARRGSYSYVAPEWLLGGAFDQRADLYALGVMMAEIWCGRPPPPRELAPGGALVDPAARRRFLERGGVPPGWLGVVTDLTAPDPCDRPSHVSQAAALWSRGLGRSLRLVSPGTVAAMLRTGPPAGREAELERCRGALEGRPVVLIGPPGIGRRTVARTSGRRAQVAGRVVEFWPTVPQVRTVQGFAATVARLLPVADLGGLVAPLDEAGAGDPDAFAAVLRATASAWVGGLRRAQRPAPRPLLVVEELDAAPALVRAVVEQLVGAPDLPIGVLATSRDYDPPEVCCALAPLDRSAVEEFMGARLGAGALTQRLASALTAASGGHPESLQSLLGLLAQRGELDYGGAGWRFSATAADVDLPRDLESAVQARLSLLDPDSHAVLGALAWLRFASDAQTVSSACGLPGGRVAELFGELESAGLVWPDGAGRLRLGHDAVAEALASWRPDGGAAAAHRRVLEGSDLAPLPRAWHVGGARGGREALDVAQGCLDDGRIEEAEVAADLALELAPAAPEALELRARIANLLGPRRTQVRCLEALIEVLPGSGVRRLEAEDALFWALTRTGEASRAEAVGQRVIALASDLEDTKILAGALVHLANVVIQRGDYGEGRKLLLRAVAIAERDGYESVQARAYNNLGNICAYRDDHEAALRLYTRAHDLKVREGDPVGERIALGNMGLMALKLDRFADAQVFFGRSLASARVTGHRRGEAWSLLALAVLGLEGGALAYAARRAEAALEIATELGDTLIACDAANTRAEVHLAAGEHTACLARARTSLALAEDVQSLFNAAGARVTMANALLADEPERAEELALRVIEAGAGDDVIRAGAERVRAEVAVARGDLSAADAAARQALAIGGRGLTPRVLVTIGRVLRLVGDVGAAQEVAATARRRVGRRVQGWQERPGDDGVDAAGRVDGPCQATFLNQPDVANLLIPDAGAASSTHTREATMDEHSQTGANSMSMNTDLRTAEAQAFDHWAGLAAAASPDELTTMLGDWLFNVVRATAAERGFLVGPQGGVIVARDADGEAVASPAKKLPEVAVQEVLSRGRSWRASGGAGSRGAVVSLPVTFAGAGEGTHTSWVLVLHNRFLPSAFEDLMADDSGLGMSGQAGLLARLNTVVVALAAARSQMSAAKHEQQKEQTRSTEEILRLRRELETTREQVGPVNRYPEIVFGSSRMKKMLRRVDRVVESGLPVYVHGESGTGKELIARAIHTLGARHLGPFVAQNCSAVPRALFESEFFGHEKGAFTGADRSSEGLFRRASGGTLFLDEIGDLTMDLQSKLLRVLETGEVRPVGGGRTINVDVRIVCATHRDLKEQVAQGAFREDLYYRLNVVRIDIPALRERPEDIPLLVKHFLELKAPPSGPPPLARGVMKALVAFDWPGNVRQLENEITRAALLCDDEIGLADLSDEVRAGALRGSRAAMSSLDARLVAKLRLDEGNLKERVDRLETWVLRDALERHVGNKSRIARELGLSRAGLNMKLKRLALWEQAKSV